MAEPCSETRQRAGKGDPGQPAAESPAGARREPLGRCEPERLRSADPRPLTETARAQRIPCYGLCLQQLSRVRVTAQPVFTPGPMPRGR